MFICGFLLLTSSSSSNMATDSSSSFQRRLFRFLRITLVCQLVLVSTCRGFFQNLADSKRHYHPTHIASNTIGGGGGGGGGGNSIGSYTISGDQCSFTAMNSIGSVAHYPNIPLGFSSFSTMSSTRLYESSSSSSSSEPAQGAPQPQSQSKQIKPPRFVQKAHSQQKKKKNMDQAMDENYDSNLSRSDASPFRGNSKIGSSSSVRRRGPPLPPGVRSDKSIEDLESVMMKRWGTLEAGGGTVSSPSKGGRGGKTKGKKGGAAGGTTVNPFQRPVLDPWAQDDGKSSNFNNVNRNVVREFYDEDDEGFEIVEWDEDNDNDDDDDGEWEWEDGGPEGASRTSMESRNPRMQISHLIAPKPAGGRGTNQPQPSLQTPTRKSQPQSARQPLTQQASSSSQSYFFNPNKQQIPPASKTGGAESKRKATAAPSAIVDKDTTASANAAQQPKTTRASTPGSGPAKPLLDEDGNPVFMTTAEALLRFQSSTSEEAVAAMMTDDEADSPLVAYQQQQQYLQNGDGSADDELLPPASWNSIGITSEVLLDNLKAMFCIAPLSVQEKAIPSVLTGNDVLVGTYTGSGKTLAFLTPLIQRLLWNSGEGDDNGDWDDFEDPGLAVLIVAPGRELASQIASVARNLLEDTPLRVQLAIGGTTFSRNLEQIRKRKPNIVVGTPGRIAELVVGKPGEKSGRLKIGNLQCLVLDEFDALLEYKPHREPTRAILQSLQRRHGDSLQSILCSATASDLMDSPKVTEYLRPGFATAMADENDVFVTGSSSPNKKGSNNKQHQRPQVSRTVLHGMVHVPHRRLALDTVRRILHTEPIPQQILIFVESARKVDVVVEKLAERGIIAAPLHGGQGSDKMDRAEVSKALREGYVGIVVATELAARGLDAPLLTHVINLDLPTDSSHYAHRAGRCGRGGRPGVVINMTTSPKERNVPKRFAETLGIDMYTVEPREGKLLMVDPETQTLDQ